LSAPPSIRVAVAGSSRDGSAAERELVRCLRRDFLVKK